MFVKKYSEKHLIVFLYVDDILIIGDNDDKIKQVCHETAVRFEMKVLGET